MTKIDVSSDEKSERQVQIASSVRGSWLVTNMSGVTLARHRDDWQLSSLFFDG